VYAYFFFIAFCRNASDLHLSFTVVGKPRITYGLKGAIVNISAAATPNGSMLRILNLHHSIADAEDVLATSAFHNALILEFQRLCAVVDSEMVRFCGFCGHQVTRGCTSCTISSFYRQISFVSDKTIQQIVSNHNRWSIEQLPINPSLQDVLSISEDSIAAATAVCSMLNSVDEKQLRSMLCFGHHSRPLTFSASDCSSISNFLHSFGLDSVNLRPNVKRASGDILHQLLHSFCSSEHRDWRSARASTAHLPCFDLFATGCPDALFRSLPLEFKSVATAEDDKSEIIESVVSVLNRGPRKFPPSSAVIWKWLRQISVYQRSHAPDSHRALLLIANRSSRRIGAYEVSPRNISFFDSYCLKLLAQRPALSLYLDAIRPYCKASHLLEQRSSSLCEIFAAQKKAARYAMIAHAELLQIEVQNHFSTTHAFISAIRQASSLPENILLASAPNSDTKFSDVRIKVPDFSRAFVNWRTLTQLLDKLHQPLSENSLHMEESYAKNVDLLMQSARACHKAACVRLKRQDHPAVSGLLKFIKSLATILRNSGGPGHDIRVMSRTGLEELVNELIVMTHSDILELPSDPDLAVKANTTIDR
jgi:hypothetical protein